jgi:hypothetical protein
MRLPFITLMIALFTMPAGSYTFSEAPPGPFSPPPVSSNIRRLLILPEHFTPRAGSA